MAQLLTEQSADLLLLDIRDAASFVQCNIIKATHYAASRLNHSQNPYTTEILQFRNKPNKMIVLYDDDEKIACNMGNLCYEKGFDNVYILSGGLHKFASQYAALLNGQAIAISPPPSPTSSVKTQSTTKTNRSTKTTTSTTTTNTTSNSTATKTSWKP